MCRRKYTHIQELEEEILSMRQYHNTPVAMQKLFFIPFALSIGQIGMTDGSLFWIPPFYQVIDCPRVLFGVAIDDTGPIRGFHVFLKQAFQLLLADLL